MVSDNSRFEGLSSEEHIFKWVLIFLNPGRRRKPMCQGI